MIGLFWTQIQGFELSDLKKKIKKKNFKCSGSEKNDPIVIKFDINHHIQDIDLHPKNEKIPKENVLPERAQAKFQKIEIARAHSTGNSS